MPLVFRLVGRGVGKVSGLVQGGRARMNELSKGSDLLQVGAWWSPTSTPAAMLLLTPRVSPWALVFHVGTGWFQGVHLLSRATARIIRSYALTLGDLKMIPGSTCRHDWRASASLRACVLMPSTNARVAPAATCLLPPATAAERDPVEP